MDRSTLCEMTLLAETVPGATLCIELAGGRRRVGRTGAGGERVSGPAALGRLRLALLFAGGEHDNELAVIESVELAGSVAALGCGLYSTVHGSTEQRWFATCLAPIRLKSLIRAELPADPRCARAVQVVTDPDLCVSVVSVGVRKRSDRQLLEESSTQLFAAFSVAEMLLELRP